MFSWENTPALHTTTTATISPLFSTLFPVNKTCVSDNRGVQTVVSYHTHPAGVAVLTAGVL